MTRCVRCRKSWPVHMFSMRRDVCRECILAERYAIRLLRHGSVPVANPPQAMIEAKMAQVKVKKLLKEMRK